MLNLRNVSPATLRDLESMTFTDMFHAERLGYDGVGNSLQHNYELRKMSVREKADLTPTHMWDPWTLQDQVK